MNYQINFWDAYFRCYDVLLAVITYQELLSDLSKALDLKKGERLLDAGCGTGNILYEIDTRRNAVTCLDANPAALDRLISKFPCCTELSSRQTTV